MPEIERDKVRAMMAEIPEDQHEALLTRLKEKGYTLPGAARPDAGTLAGQKAITQATDQISTPKAAWESLKGAASTDVPGLAQATEAVRTQIPDWIAKKGGQMGMPNAGNVAGAAIGTVGQFMPKTVGDLAALAVEPAMKVGAAIPGVKPAIGTAGKVGGTVVRESGEILAQIAAKLSGSEPEAVKAVFKNPKISAKFAEKIGQWEQANLVQEVKESMGKVGQQFRAIQDGIAGFGLGDRKAILKADMKPVLQNTVQDMIANGHRVPKEFTGVKPVLRVGRLAEDSPDYHNIVKQLAGLKKTPSLDFGEALNLKRKLDDMINYGIEGGQGMQKLGSEGNRVLKVIRKHVNEQLRQSLPDNVRAEWDAANKAVEVSHRAYDELKKEIVGQTPQMTVMRIMRQIRTGAEDRALTGKAAKIGESAERAFQDIRDRVVASQFKKWVGGTGGSGAMAILTGTSPRMVGYGTAAAGGIAHTVEDIAGRALAHPTALTQATMALLRQHAPATP